MEDTGLVCRDKGFWQLLRLIVVTMVMVMRTLTKIGTCKQTKHDLTEKTNLIKIPIINDLKGHNWLCNCAYIALCITSLVKL